MGGKSSTSQQSVSIPPAVLAQYSSVNAAANQTAQTPFQQYSGQFVAPVNSQQQTGIAGTNTAANEAQPYYGAATGTLGNAQAGTTGINNAATGLAAASSEQVNPTALTGQDINQYLSPYLGDVLGSESALLNQNNQQQQAGQLGNAISSGAFGGDRTGLAAANLEQQQNLSNANIYSGILNQGYNTALSTAQQQQGVGLAAGQANRAALASSGSELASIGQTQYGEGANTASELAGLGAGAQTAGLQGAQAEIGAGTLEQQTAQAQDTAQYNQFLQQQSYPFQVDQFLANIAEGTGALSGSTTTTTQPGGFFSDRRLKHDIKKIGKTYDGQTIYSYRMHGDNRTHIGLIAQEVEKKRPGAVGLAAGYKTVDYGEATRAAANRGHFYSGGVVPIRPGLAYGGSPSVVDPADLSAILQAQQQMYAPMSGSTGVYGGVAGGVPRGGSSRVPAPTGAVAHLVTAEGGLRAQPTGAQNVKTAGELYNLGSGIYKGANTPAKPAQAPVAAAPVNSAPAGGVAPQTDMPPVDAVAANDDGAEVPESDLACGGVAGYALGGMPMARARSGVPGAAPGMGGGLSGGAPPVARMGAMRRPGFDSGGTPYSYDDGTLNIPDENPHNTLAHPAALPPQAPSGFQQLMSMGSGNMSGIGSSIGNSFSGLGGGAGASGVDSGEEAGDATDAAGDAADAFEFASRGGVAGRRKRDDGGFTDADSADDRNQGVDADTPDTSIAMAPALKQGAPNTSLNSVATVAKDVWPVAEAFLLARGGVAGRRGYDAGGDPTQDPDILPDTVVSSDAPAPVTYSGGVSPSAAPVDDPTPAPVAVDSPGLWDKIKGSALAKPENLVPLLSAISAMGTAPTRHLGVALAAGLGAGAQSYLPAQAQSIENQKAQLGLNAMQGAIGPTSSAPVAPRAAPTANAAPPTDPAALTKFYQQKYSVPPMTPDEAAGLEHAQVAGGYLKNPGIAQQAQTKIQQRINTDKFNNQQAAIAEHDALYNALPTMNPADQAIAIAKINAIHPFTDDKYDDNAGQRVNSRTGAPAVGAAAQTLTPQQKQEAYQKAYAQGIEPTTVGVGLPTPPWVRARAASPDAYARAQVPGYDGPSVPQPSPPSRAAAPGPTATRPTIGAPQTQMLPGVNLDAFPKLPPLPAVTDQPSKARADARAESDVKNQNDALSTMRDQASASSRNTAIYSQLEKNLATADPREFGPSSSSYKALANLKTYLTGLPPDGLVNQAEVDKYLSQLGVGGSKQLLGADQQLRQQEMLLLMSHANPNIDQPLQVIKNLAAFGKAGNEYDLKAANTGIAAIRGGADPFQVPGAIEHQAHRADYVTGRLNTPQSAIDHLSAHPELAPQFKAKYGYLP